MRAYDEAILSDDGKILSFDLPGFEFYSVNMERPMAKIVREGRLKHLSSRHRLGGPSECSRFEDEHCQ
jgi:hypothetical protein